MLSFRLAHLKFKFKADENYNEGRIIMRVELSISSDSIAIIMYGSDLRRAPLRRRWEILNF